MTRKDRRALAHERELKGLPKARPWSHRKTLRLQRISEVFKRHDEMIAAECGISVQLVQHLRSRSQDTLKQPEPVTS
jgi:hypothetical protein